MKEIFLRSTYNLLGAISCGNGLWMMLSESTWFAHMPVAAIDTGPLNSHFVHDVGLMYVLSALGAFWCGYKLKNCFEIHLWITLFLTGHALIHITEILNGSLPPSHWLIDFPLVTFPAIVLLCLTPLMLQRKNLI